MKLRVYNETLDPNIWNTKDKSLKPEIKDALLKIAEDFYKTTDLTADIQNILLLGSCANYNWTPTSDMDLHVIIDIADEKIHEEYARKFMETLSFKWNTEHDIEIKGHPVEVYLQDVREPNSNAQQAREGSAIYSVFDDKWILEPNKQNIKIDSDKIRKKFFQLKKRIDSLTKTKDVDHLKSLMKSIKKYRDSGLSEGGEFSVENLVFKALRKSGDLQKIKDTITSVYDTTSSIPENGNIQKYKKTNPLNENKEPFIVVGIVNDDLEVKGDTSGKGHTYLRFFRGIRWRYNSKTNTIYWWPGESGSLSEKQKDAVLNYLHTKFNVINPKNLYNDEDYFLHGHSLTERLLNKKANLYLGFIDSDNLNVVGKDAEEEEEDTHHNYMLSLGGDWLSKGYDKIIPWRYKKQTNTIYWWMSHSHPNEDEKQAVVIWLEKNINIKNPLHKFISWGPYMDKNDRIDAHTIDENKLDKYKEILSIVKANLKYNFISPWC